ncbi:CDP-alcohol phosphatidyltransferase family protein [Robiginitalea sp.]|jgi:phosphatidylglycerophosphate synthase|nr:CDP-alcohol phosphatidyltransferase family protein [Robiginitalea sp.]
MKKLGEGYTFIDFSDYGRPLSNFIAFKLKNTSITAIHLTLLFGLVGILACIAILRFEYLLTLVLLVLKSIIDGADGALARLKQKPSYIGRYLDSLFDFVLNFFLLGAIWMISELHWYWWIAAFFSMELQGTLYNFYYVILRNRISGGDDTSKVFEYKVPIGLHGESQYMVTVLFKCYIVCYGLFDRIIHFLDPKAHQDKTIKPWLMSFVSLYGLGFQLLLLGLGLIFLTPDWVLQGLVLYTGLLPLVILFRKSNL